MPEPTDLRYAKSHEWARAENDTATFGITRHAEEELGDVALVLLPEVGRVLQQGERFGEIESIKAVSDLFAPVGGTVTETNQSLANAPEAVNEDPYNAGWMVRVKMSNPAELEQLMDSAAYEALVEAL